MKLMVIAAHPDDPEYFAAGVIKKYSAAGHRIKCLLMTNGDAGHHELRGLELIEKRRRETWAAGTIGGFEYQILNNHDGKLQPTIELREDLISWIRSFAPDLILTHRPNDYHPDHRATGQLVQDASYLLTVPSIVAREPHLRKMPVICYMEDDFTKPIPFEADVAISIDDTIDDKTAMLDAHDSQFYEWLPYNQGILDQVPADKKARKIWLGRQVRARAMKTADRFRMLLRVLYGIKTGEAIQFAEAFEACEYGTPLSKENRRTLFPFF